MRSVRRVFVRGAFNILNIFSFFGILAACFSLSACSSDSGSCSGSACPDSASTALSGLGVSRGTLSPAFSPSTLAYSVLVPFTASDIQLTPTAQSPDATIEIDGFPVPSGTTAPPLPVGTTAMPIMVNIVVRKPGVPETRYVLVIGRYPSDYLKASNTNSSQRFGYSVALSGDTLAVGAYLDDGGFAGVNGDPFKAPITDSGAVFVFVRSGGTWTQQAYIKAENPDMADRFGVSLALSGDTLAVGTPYEASSATGINGSRNDNTAADSGAVYVFQRTGTTWAQQAYVKASNSAAGDSFGYSVALSGDTLAVGAYREDSSATGVNSPNQADNSAGDSGAVYVFQRTGTTWTQQAYVKSSNPGPGDSFGYSVALSGDTLAVGAHQEDSSATGIGGDQANNTASNSGAVYVFQRTGAAWAQQAYIKASTSDITDNFGASVALSGDTLAVGAPGEDSRSTGLFGNQSDNSATDSGAVYVFLRTGAVWAQTTYLKASNTDAEDSFGTSLALLGDFLLIGAYQEDSKATGFGGDASDNSAMGSGAAYLFQRFNGGWLPSSYLKASNTGNSDRFGFSVAVSSDTLAVGASYESSSARGLNGNQDDNSATTSGAVYLFR